MTERERQRRAFLRMSVLGAGGLAAGAAALWVARRSPEAPVESGEFAPSATAGTTSLRPWLGFAAAGALDRGVVPAASATGRLSASAVRLHVAGQVPATVPDLREVALDVLFGPDAQFPFHAWSASLAPSRSVSAGVGCRVPLLPRGLAMRLTLQAETAVVHDLILGGPGGAAPLAPGHYFVALAPVAPRWADYEARAEAGGAPRLLRADASAPAFACVGLTVTPA